MELKPQYKVFADNYIENGGNATDAARMLDPQWQSLLAKSIADGIDDFFKGGDN